MCCWKNASLHVDDRCAVGSSKGSLHVAAGARATRFLSVVYIVFVPTTRVSLRGQEYLYYGIVEIGVQSVVSNGALSGGNRDLESLTRVREAVARDCECTTSQSEADQYYQRESAQIRHIFFAYYFGRRIRHTKEKRAFPLCFLGTAVQVLNIHSASLVNNARFRLEVAEPLIIDLPQRF